MSEHHPLDPQPTPENQLTATSARGVSKSRRNLLRGALAGGPALLALQSTPVVACTCKLPSGFTVSGNLSRGPKNCVAPGRKASTWASTTNCKTNSPYNYYSGSTTFTVYKATLVGTGSGTLGKDYLGLTTNNYTGTMVSDWLAAGDTTDQGLVMACYLESIISGGPNFPTTAMIKAMWNSGVQGAGYTPPNQAIAWGKTQVIGYLKYLTGQVSP